MNQTKPMPKLAAALAFLASLLLIVSLLFTALQLVMHDETWFAARYEAYGTAGEIGIPTKDITAALMQLIDYMEGDVASIDLTVMENGIPVSMYNERETLHMVDVRELYQAWRSVRDFGVPAAALLLLGACALLPKGARLRTLSKGYLRASVFFGAIVAALGSSLVNLLIALATSQIPQFARIVRSSVMAVKGSEYVEAAKAVGASDALIIAKYIIPNALSPVIVQGTLGVATTILNVAGMSFLGLGIQPPAPEWGSIFSSARVYMREAWHISVFPGLAIVICILSLNLLGDGLRDALDPKQKR